jgi:hypothetical protein
LQVGRGLQFPAASELRFHPNKGRKSLTGSVGLSE